MLLWFPDSCGYISHADVDFCSWAVRHVLLLIYYYYGTILSSICAACALCYIEPIVLLPSMCLCAKQEKKRARPCGMCGAALWARTCTAAKALYVPPKPAGAQAEPAEV